MPRSKDTEDTFEQVGVSLKGAMKKWPAFKSPPPTSKGAKQQHQERRSTELSAHGVAARGDQTSKPAE